MTKKNKTDGNELITRREMTKNNKTDGNKLITRRDKNNEKLVHDI